MFEIRTADSKIFSKVYLFYSSPVWSKRIPWFGTLTPFNLNCNNLKTLFHDGMFNKGLDRH